MVGFQTEGARKFRGLHQHRWEVWREFHIQQGDEKNRADFLHLIDTHRVKMYIKILKYFFYRTTFSSEVAMVTGEEGETLMCDEVVSAASEIGGEVVTAAPENAGEVVKTAPENDEADMAGDTESIDTDGMTDTVTDEIVLSDTEPDVTLLDMPDDETNSCCQNVQFLIILPLNFRPLKMVPGR